MENKLPVVLADRMGYDLFCMGMMPVFTAALVGGWPT
jgi:hypothetical protein